MKFSLLVATLAFSVALNCWLWRHTPPPRSEPAATASAPEPLPASRPAVKFEPAVKPPELETGEIAEPPPLPVRRLPEVSEQVRSFAVYADLIANELETLEQHQELSRVLCRWVATDPLSAALWIDQQESSPQFDLAISAVSSLLTRAGDYAAAADWAEEIQTPEVRQESLARVYTEAYREGRIAADALSQTGLAEEEIRKIIDGSRLD